jgi:fluoride exporter
MLTLLVSLAAGVGAVLRYVVDSVVAHRTRGPFPLGTFIVNVTGSFVLGLVVGLSTQHGLGDQTAVVLGIGLTGGYTTMSTWAWESLALVEEGAVGVAAWNVVASVAAGLAAAAAGLAVGRL